MIAKDTAEPVRAATMPGHATSRRSADAATIISILLVDDPDADAARVAGALEACSEFEVALDHVCEAAEARRIWERGDHDLAIFDLWLGRGTSVELLSAFADDTARPVVVLSSLPYAETRAFSAAACDLLVHSKENLSPGALAETLGVALARPRRTVQALVA